MVVVVVVVAVGSNRSRHSHLTYRLSKQCGTDSHVGGDTGEKSTGNVEKMRVRMGDGRME